MSLSEFVMMMMLATRILSMQKQRIPRVVAFLAAGVAMIYVTDILISEPLVLHLAKTAIFILWLWLYIKEKSWYDFFVIYGLLFIFGVVMQLISVLLVSTVDSGFEMSFKYGIICQTVAIFITLAMCVFMPLNKYYDYVKNRNSIIRLMVINIYFIYFVLSTLTHINADVLQDAKIMISIMVVFTAVLNVVLLKVKRVSPSE